MLLAEVADKMYSITDIWPPMLGISAVLFLVALRWRWFCLIWLPLAIWWAIEMASFSFAWDIYPDWVRETGLINVWVVAAADFVPLVSVLIVICIHLSRRWRAHRKTSEAVPTPQASPE